MVLLLTFSACGAFCWWVLRIKPNRTLPTLRARALGPRDSLLEENPAYLAQIKEQQLQQVLAYYKAKASQAKQDLQAANRIAYIKAIHHDQP